MLLLDFISQEVFHINLIKSLRVNKEMTQTQLAELCGVSQGTVALWEKGICFPKAGKVPAVARALGCDSSQLLRMAEERCERKEVG